MAYYVAVRKTTASNLKGADSLVNVFICDFSRFEKMTNFRRRESYFTIRRYQMLGWDVSTQMLFIIGLATLIYICELVLWIGMSCAIWETLWKSKMSMER